MEELDREAIKEKIKELLAEREDFKKILEHLNFAYEGADAAMCVAEKTLECYDESELKKKSLETITSTKKELQSSKGDLIDIFRKDIEEFMCDIYMSAIEDLANLYTDEEKKRDEQSKSSLYI